MRPFDSVVLNQDLPDYDIKAGTQGAIVEEFDNGNAFMVEFFDDDNHTIDVVDVRADQLTLQLADFFDDEQIALIVDIPQHQLRRGQVGIIKKRIDVGLYEVEFSSKNGTVYARASIHANHMMLLYWQSQLDQRSA